MIVEKNKTVNSVVRLSQHANSLEVVQEINSFVYMFAEKKHLEIIPF